MFLLPSSLFWMAGPAEWPFVLLLLNTVKGEPCGDGKSSEWTGQQRLSPRHMRLSIISPTALRVSLSQWGAWEHSADMFPWLFSTMCSGSFLSASIQVISLIKSPSHYHMDMPFIFQEKLSANWLIHPDRPCQPSLSFLQLTFFVSWHLTQKLLSVALAFLRERGCRKDPQIPWLWGDILQGSQPSEKCFLPGSQSGGHRDKDGSIIGLACHIARLRRWDPGSPAAPCPSCLSKLPGFLLYPVHQAQPSLKTFGWSVPSVPIPLEQSKCFLPSQCRVGKLLWSALCSHELCAPWS